MQWCPAFFPEGIGDCWSCAKPAGELAEVLEARLLPETFVLIRNVVLASEALRGVGFQEDVKGLCFATVPAAAAYLRRLEWTVQVVERAMAGCGGPSRRLETASPTDEEPLASEELELSELEMDFKVAEEARRWEAVMAQQVEDSFGNFAPPCPLPLSEVDSLALAHPHLGAVGVEEDPSASTAQVAGDQSVGEVVTRTGAYPAVVEVDKVPEDDPPSSPSVLDCLLLGRESPRASKNASVNPPDARQQRAFEMKLPAHSFSRSLGPLVSVPAKPTMIATGSAQGGLPGASFSGGGGSHVRYLPATAGNFSSWAVPVQPNSSASSSTLGVTSQLVIHPPVVGRRGGEFVPTLGQLQSHPVAAHT